MIPPLLAAVRPRAKELLQTCVDELLNLERMELVAQLFSPTFVDHDPLPGGRPDRRGLERALSDLFASAARIRFTLEAAVSEDDLVAYRLFGQGSSPKDLFDTEAVVLYECTGMYRVREGRFTERWGPHRVRYL